jgi:hypothetical protein
MGISDVIRNASDKFIKIMKIASEIVSLNSGLRRFDLSIKAEYQRHEQVMRVFGGLIEAIPIQGA